MRCCAVSDIQEETISPIMFPAIPQVIPSIVPQWPETTRITYAMKSFFDDMFEQYPTMISEYSFAGLYMFASKYHYALTSSENVAFIVGKEYTQPFVMFPMGMPSRFVLNDLFERGFFIKALSRKYMLDLTSLSFDVPIQVVSDRGDFDYIYTREHLATLSGQKYHKKRNHVNYFTQHYSYHTVPITQDNMADVFSILNIWKAHHKTEGDYEQVKKALLQFDDLSQFGQITYVDDTPAGFIFGEYYYNSSCCVVHAEKADIRYKGIYQYINKTFAEHVPNSCPLINREQDLGDEGLRKAKFTYRPSSLLKKFRIYKQ